MAQSSDFYRPKRRYSDLSFPEKHELLSRDPAAFRRLKAEHQQDLANPIPAGVYSKSMAELIAEGETGMVKLHRLATSADPAARALFDSMLAAHRAKRVL
jgi:hypothetical protein